MRGARISWLLTTSFCCLTGLAIVGCGSDESSPSRVASGGGGPPTANAPPPTCSASGGGINLEYHVSRLAGVAPLAVFFDATGTTATSTGLPFHELDYSWDFGDLGSGSWANGTGSNNSRNEAYGPVAAHVYRQPGTYTVQLTVRDGTNPPLSSSCATIVVADPEVVFAGVNTVCVSSAPDFTDCPSTVRVTSNDFDSAIAANIGPGKRILFRRGETFLASTAARITGLGPGTIGAFGPGTGRAVVQLAGAVSAIAISSNTTPETSDWRIMDLELDGTSLAASVGVNARGSANNILLQNLFAHDIAFGFSFDPNVLDLINNPVFSAPMWDVVVIADSSVQRLIGDKDSGANACFCASARFGFLGNFIDNSPIDDGVAQLGGEHGLRSMYISKGAISHNTIQGIRDEKANITLRTQDFSGTPTLGAQPYTEQVVVSDNRVIGGNDPGATPSVAGSFGGVGPRNPDQDGRARDMIWERNWFIAGSITVQGVSFEASRITFRNNVLNFTGAPEGRGVTASNSSTFTPDPSDIWIFNNTFFRADAGTATFRPVVLNNGSSNIVVSNNLAYAPTEAAPIFLTPQGSATFTLCSTCNSSDLEILTDPVFQDPAMNDLPDWQINAGSYAADRGISVPVLFDLYRAQRPQGPTHSMGATER